MGLSGGGWEDDEDVQRAAPPPAAAYGLEVFKFDPGPVPTQEELRKDADRRVQDHPQLKEVLRREKAAITDILQSCLEKVQDQLERGEAVCRKAHFPLVNPINFDDLEDFAQHDHFTVDLRVDHVDEALRSLVKSLLGIVWNTVEVENVKKAKSLDRFAEALHERMRTLEHHLHDRSRQLKNCRYAYFKEITHLRNQLYIQSQEGEDFEPVEAYFFDPTEFLEEELRQQLNDKITLSVKVYHEKLVALKRLVSDLELRLETAQALNNSRGLDHLESYLQAACSQHSAKKTVAALGSLQEKEMQKWAAAWATSAGWMPSQGSSSPAVETENAPSAKSLEAMREAMKKAHQEAADERALRSQAEEALERAQKELQEFRYKLDAAESRGKPDGNARKSVVVQGGGLNVADNTEEMDEFRKKVEIGKINLEKEKERTAAASQKAAQAQDRIKALEEEIKQAGTTTTLSTGNTTDEEKQQLEDYEQTWQALRESGHVAPGSRRKTLRGSAEDLIDALRDRQERLSTLEVASSKLQKSIESYRADAENAQQRFAESERRMTAALQLSEAQREELRDARRARQAELSVQSSDSELADLPLPEQVGNRWAALGSGFEVEVQTNITANGGNFYLLEEPAEGLEAIIRAELDELNACSDVSRDSVLSRIRKSHRPPVGSGSGLCSRGEFLRLFYGVKVRLGHYEELVDKINSLRRSELQQVIEGVHFLMDSAIPDDDVGLRDSIFGRGITQVMLDNTRDPLPFADLVKRWGRKLKRIIGHVLKACSSVHLGVHPNRRIFVPVIGATTAHVGESGGDLPARQRKDFSPPRPRLYENTGEQRAAPSSRRQASPEEPRQMMSLSGRTMVPFGDPGSELVVQSETAFSAEFMMLNSADAEAYAHSSIPPKIVVNGRLVPRAVDTALSQDIKLPNCNEADGYASANEPAGQRQQRGLPCIEGTSLPPAATRAHSPEAFRHRSSSPLPPSPFGRSRQASPANSVIEQAAEEADAFHLQQEAALQNVGRRSPRSAFGAEPSGATRTAQPVEDVQPSSVEAFDDASLHVPMLYLPFGGTAAQEVEARLAAHDVGVGTGLAAVRNARAGSTEEESSAATRRRPGTATVSERPGEDPRRHRPGTAPPRAGPTAPPRADTAAPPRADTAIPAAAASSVCDWRPLTYGRAAADPERSLERERKRWIEISSVPRGACQPSSATGQSSHTRPMARIASAGRIRPAGRASANNAAMCRSASSGALGSSAKGADGVTNQLSVPAGNGLPPPSRWLPKPAVAVTGDGSRPPDDVLKPPLNVHKLAGAAKRGGMRQ
eukprot:TRINITY_DN44757_c0_g1_i1.p1 TRINITY_DN44757_c0_g1~~TRINITY_DN44757_c0_g1_i1.p1  ORF type:complete len:1324 (+),score=265.28 TRINITY_DN44757_c0_g1_i1:51-3974(+)